MGNGKIGGCVCVSGISDLYMYRLGRNDQTVLGELNRLADMMVRAN